MNFAAHLAELPRNFNGHSFHSIWFSLLQSSRGAKRKHSSLRLSQIDSLVKFKTSREFHYGNGNKNDIKGVKVIRDLRRCGAVRSGSARVGAGIMERLSFQQVTTKLVSFYYSSPPLGRRASPFKAGEQLARGRVEPRYYIFILIPPRLGTRSHLMQGMNNFFLFTKKDLSFISVDSERAFLS